MTTPHTLTAVLDLDNCECEPGEKHSPWCFEYTLTCPGVTDDCREWETCKACTAADRKALGEQYENTGDSHDLFIAHEVRHWQHYETGEFLIGNSNCWAAADYHDLSDRAYYLDIAKPGTYPVDVSNDGDGGLDLGLVDEPAPAVFVDALGLVPSANERIEVQS